MRVRDRVRSILGSFAALDAAFDALEGTKDQPSEKRYS